MIELREGLILAKNAPKEPVSFLFDKGQLNLVDYQHVYQFNFLGLKNQSLDKGTFIIDEVQVYPDEENNDKTIFFLAVNSLICLSLCFVVTKADKKQRVQEVQNELIKLRDLPTEQEEDKQKKIVSIFDTVLSLKPSYVLYDFNNENNKQMGILPSFFEKYAQELTIIALDNKPVVEVVEPPKRIRTKEKSTEKEPEIELSIGEPINEVREQKPKEKSKGKAKQKDNRKPEKVVEETNRETSIDDFLTFDVNNSHNFFKFFWHALKENIMVYLSFVIPVVGVMSFCLLIPLYMNGDSKWLLIPFILTIVICFSLYMLMTYKCTDYLTNKNDLDRGIKIATYSIINFLFAVLGTALGVGVYLLFKNFNNSFKSLPFDKLSLIAPIIIFVIIVTANLYVRFIGEKIVKLFKRK